MSFYVAYEGSPRAHACIRAALSARGLRPSLPQDRACILEWTCFSKSRWTRHAAHDAFDDAATELPFTSCAPARTLWSDKRGLAALRALAADELAAAGCVLPVTVPVADCRDASLLRAAIASAAPSIDGDSAGRLWVVKTAHSNNATGVRIMSDDELACDDTAVPHGEPEPGVVQAYMGGCLLRGHKLHARVNVVCVGARPAVFVHRDIVCHVATSPWVAGSPSDASVHITNHSVQRFKPGYERGAHTPLLREVLTELAGCREEEVDGVESAVLRVIASALTALCVCARGRCGLRAGSGPRFITCPNGFEVFGVDVLLLPSSPSSSGACWASGLRVCVLEVNAGPAMEGEARPDTCAALVEEVVQLAVDPWLVRAREGVSGADVPVPTSHPAFVRAHTHTRDDGDTLVTAAFMAACTRALQLESQRAAEDEGE